MHVMSCPDLEKRQVWFKPVPVIAHTPERECMERTSTLGRRQEPLQRQLRLGYGCTLTTELGAWPEVRWVRMADEIDQTEAAESGNMES
jgi:hypothetical protein